jgi:VCBS repeat-containing protein
MKTIAVLAVLVLSLISVSSAAGPRAMPDLFKGQCGVELSVPAPGILKNDVKSSGQLKVLDSEKISINPKYGTLTVNEDGSFVYEAAQNIAQGTYVSFYYKVTDGSKKTSTALVKIQISCVCRGIAPDVTVCPSTKITSNFLISEGGRCTGCRDMTPKFDLRKIPAHPVAGTCYPYTASCSGCGLVTGHVCFEGCTITSSPFTIGPDVTPTAEQIQRDGSIAWSIACNCDNAPMISKIHKVQDHWEYTITCQSECGSTTGTGVVNIGQTCEITPPLVFPIMDCPAILPTPDQVIAQSGLSCGCDATTVITDIHWLPPQPENGVQTGEYTYTCTFADGSTSSGVGQFETAMSDCNQPMSTSAPTATAQNL